MRGATRRDATIGLFGVLAGVTGILPLAVTALAPATKAARSATGRAGSGLQAQSGSQWLALAEQGVSLAQRSWNPRREPGRSRHGPGDAPNAGRHTELYAWLAVYS